MLGNTNNLNQMFMCASKIYKTRNNNPLQLIKHRTTYFMQSLKTNFAVIWSFCRESSVFGFETLVKWVRVTWLLVQAASVEAKLAIVFIDLFLSFLFFLFLFLFTSIAFDQRWVLGILSKLKFCFPPYFGITRRNLERF